MFPVLILGLSIFSKERNDSLGSQEARDETSPCLGERSSSPVPSSVRRLFPEDATSAMHTMRNAPRY